MNGDRSLVAYRQLLRLYPRGFRSEYGDDMAIVFADLLQEEPPARVWWRTLLDLFRSVPPRHLEARRAHARPSVLPGVLGALAAAGLVLGGLAGTVALGVTGFALTAAAVAGTGAVMAHRRRPDDRWSQLPAGRLVAAGAALLATLLVVIVPSLQPLDERTWAPLMLACIGSVLMIAAGVILGVAGRLAERRR